jgi:hypothetical protein
MRNHVQAEDLSAFARKRQHATGDVDRPKKRGQDRPIGTCVRIDLDDDQPANGHLHPKPTSVRLFRYCTGNATCHRNAMNNERSINDLAGNQIILRRGSCHLGVSALSRNRASARDSNRRTKPLLITAAGHQAMSSPHARSGRRVRSARLPPSDPSFPPDRGAGGPAERPRPPGSVPPRSRPPRLRHGA